MKSGRASLRWMIGVVFLVPILLIFIAIFPFVYNENFSSLGRFSNNIEVGMSVDQVLDKINYYEIDDQSSITIHYSSSDIGLYGEEMPGSRIIAIHQESIFDDIQFRMLFKNDVLFQKVFISD